MWYSFRKAIVLSRRRAAKLWRSNSGNWIWLTEKPVPFASLHRSLWRGAEPSINYYVLLFLSGVISAAGLLSNSAATIIGAMIIAPLIGPIIGIAFAMVMGNRRLIKRASLALLTGLALPVLTAALLSWSIGFNTLTPEIIARTRPNLIDLGVALSAGAAGAFAKTRRGIADALPGVAIAVALVPPLSVMGIGMTLQSQEVAIGSTLLFATNLTGIIFSGGVVFLWQRYGSLERAQQGLLIAVLALVALGIPLGLSLHDLVFAEQIRANINFLIRQRSLTFSDTDIRQLTVNQQNGELEVILEVAVTEGRISENQVALVRDFLEEQLGRSISLRVNIIPITQLEALSSESLTQ